jgi:polysaccharide deacetylase family protein (PEP-CTERM system associated)
MVIWLTYGGKGCCAMFIMSIDLESWLHRPIFHVPLERQTRLEDGDFIPRAVELLLGELAAVHAKATFFCLGSVAEWYPETMQEIAAEGHELAVHGYTHRPLHEHTRASLEDEVKRTVDLLSRGGERPIGFRAPTFTYASYLYEVLEEQGFKYDSSIMPVRTPLYNWSMYGNSAPFWISPSILEVPLSVHKVPLLRRVPVGGIYFRLLGGRVDSELLKRVERAQGIAVFYVHPWEILDNPRVALSWPKRVLAYHRIPSLRSFERVLRSFPWTDFRDSLDLIIERLSSAAADASPGQV